MAILERGPRGFLRQLVATLPAERCLLFVLSTPEMRYYRFQTVRLVKVSDAGQKESGSAGKHMHPSHRVCDCFSMRGFAAKQIAIQLHTFGNKEQRLN